MLADAALGLWSDHNAPLAPIAFPGVIAGILWTRVSPAGPAALGAVLAALALIGCRAA